MTENEGRLRLYAKLSYLTLTIVYKLDLIDIKNHYNSSLYFFNPYSNSKSRQ